MPRRLPCLFVLASLGAVACSQSTVGTAITPLTALEVDPAEFLGTVTCGSGQMQAYVATITDVSRFRGPSGKIDAGLSTSSEQCSPAKECFSLPSSGPVPCHQPVLFQRIAVGRQYVADVDGYDREDLQPLSVGSRIMLDPSTKEIVPPRWRTSCARHLGPAAVATPPDAGPRHDAGDAGRASDAGDAGHAPPADASSSATAGPSLPEKPDSGSWYYECRAARHPDSGVPWLEGPVCALEFETLTFKGCDPLHEL